MLNVLPLPPFLPGPKSWPSNSLVLWPNVKTSGPEVLKPFLHVKIYLSFFLKKGQCTDCAPCQLYGRLYEHQNWFSRACSMRSRRSGLRHPHLGTADTGPGQLHSEGCSGPCGYLAASLPVPPSTSHALPAVATSNVPKHYQMSSQQTPTVLGWVMWLQQGYGLNKGAVSISVKNVFPTSRDTRH